MITHYFTLAACWCTRRTSQTFRVNVMCVFVRGSWGCVQTLLFMSVYPGVWKYTLRACWGTWLLVKDANFHHCVFEQAVVHSCDLLYGALDQNQRNMTSVNALVSSNRPMCLFLLQITLSKRNPETETERRRERERRTERWRRKENISWWWRWRERMETWRSCRKVSDLSIIIHNTHVHLRLTSDPRSESETRVHFLTWTSFIILIVRMYY